MKSTLIFFLFFAGLGLRVIAQEQEVQGIVFDKDSKQRLTRVYLYNTRTHTGYYNNLKGEFTFPAQKGDTLVVALQGYRVDTTTIKSEATLIVYLKRTTILLKEVAVTDTVLSPAAKLEETKKDYTKIYGLTSRSKDLISMGGNSGMGAGLSIDALYTLFSREGKNARFLQQIIERDYREAMISYRYTKKLVGSTTGLEGHTLEDFMQQYRPSYNFILEANDYYLLHFIRSSYQQYLKNPRAYRLPRLNGGANK